MEQHKAQRPESQERDERRPNDQPYKRRKRRKTPYPNIDRGRTRAEANAERQARNSARTKLKPQPVDDADRPEPATRNAAITARAVEEKEPGAARQELAGQDAGAVSADIETPPREERSDPRTEDRQREVPVSPGRAWSRAREQAHNGVQPGCVIDGMAEGVGKVIGGIAESLWSVFDGGGRKPMSQEQEKGAGAAWAKAAQQQKAAAEQARQAEMVKQPARHRRSAATSPAAAATTRRCGSRIAGSRATTENGEGAKQDRPGLRPVASARHDAAPGWEPPRRSLLDVGAAFEVGAVAITSPKWIMTPEATAGRERPVLNFWQRLASEGVSILALVIDTGDPLAGRPRSARWGPRPARGSLVDGQDDVGERAVIEREFAAKVAAAWLCTPRAALGAVVQALRQEQRSRLAALQAKVAARRGVKTAEALAQHYRRLAEMVARGVPVPAQRPNVEDVRQRIRAAIMRNQPG